MTEPDGLAGQAVIAEAVGLALLVVLESLTPPERLAFVLHDIFAVPSGDIGQIMGRTRESARQLASRGGGPAAPLQLTGAQAVAEHVLRTAPRFLPHAVPATVNGTPGALFGTWDEPLCVVGFTVEHGKIAELHLIADRAKLRHLRLGFTPRAHRP
jgi:RNA polymerase sigma-70 factor, ECF subfamily